GLPGKAIVAAGIWSEPFAKGQGAERIEGADQSGHFPTYRLGVAASTKHPTIMREVDIPPDAEEFTVEFALDRGRAVRLRTTDDAGQAIGNLRTAGVVGRERWSSVAESECEIVALARGEERTVLLHQPDRRLGKALQISAADSPDELVVELEPCVTFRGQLVDDNQQPISGARIRVSPRPGGDFSPELELVATDEEGRFEHAGVLPGTSYRVMAASTRTGFATLADDLAVSPGETVDLGTIDVTSDERPEPERVEEDPKASASTEVKVVAMRGRVVDDTGQPIPNATVQVVQSRRLDWVGNAQHRVLGSVKTDNAGRFVVDVPHVDHEDAKWRNRLADLDWGPVDLTASA
ncbi:MAG: carboxypeptidase-like regulatory domain-containing protein, partial [Planctomycetota bacterium]